MKFDLLIPNQNKVGRTEEKEEDVCGCAATSHFIPRKNLETGWKI